MLMTQSISEINVLLLRQLSSFFVLSEDDKKAVEQSVPCALDKCERSFSKTRNKYYGEPGVTKFDPLHGRKWSRFLYELARCIFLGGGGVFE